MLFFTPAWMSGDCQEDALSAYAARIQVIGRNLPAGVLHVIRTVSLHDARIQSVRVSGARLVLLLRCGDVQVGYFDVELTYRDLSFAMSDLGSLPAVCAEPTEELLWDEFDLVGDMIVHRILFRSLREVSLAFRDMDYRFAPAVSRSFERGVDDLRSILAAQQDAAADDRPQAGDRA